MTGATDAVDELVAASRTLGGDPSLVLHGGGNTSVKGEWTEITGKTVDALYVKGSGWDLATIERAGFAPLRLARLHDLLALERLSDRDMVRELSLARLDPDAPQPSVEALLHAFLPFPAVLHSHADVILTLTNTPAGERLVRHAFGDAVVVVPYVMPGFELARAVVGYWAEQAHAGTVGMVLMHHGLFTFAASAAEALARHDELVARAADAVGAAAEPAPCDVPAVDPIELAELRRCLSHAAGRPMIVGRHTDAPTMRFVRRDDVADVATRGPVTPDHVIRTKRIPLVGRDIDAYAAAYRDYFDTHAHRARTEITMLDPAPRIVLDREWGMLAAGPRAADAAIAADVYHHTIDVITACEDRFGGWQPLGPAELFDVEYWDLEQAKLRRAGAPPPLAGQVAAVTGAASGIGRACAAALLADGAAVIGIDRAGGVAETFGGPAWAGLVADVTDRDALSAAIATGVERFGGVDIAVLAAGTFGRSAPIAELDPGEWSNVLAVNLDGVAFTLGALHALLARSPAGGRVVVIGSKNVAAPGPGAAAYSASKAAVTQLARVAALEWAAGGIRVNTVHPDAVFDTGLWTEELLAERAARYGMTVAQYKQRNLLHTEVTSELVAAAVVQLCGPAFAATTGAQVAIDGGNERTL